MADARRVATQMARRYFKNPRDQAIFLRQMNQEAGFRDVTSPAGAQGPAQIMPATAKAWGVANVHDPVQAYQAAAEHMRAYYEQFGHDWAKALTAYNAGPGAVNGPLPAETRNYISSILGGSGDAGASSAAAALPTQSVQLAQRKTFDQAGFDQAKREFVLGTMIARHEPDSILLRSGVLSTSAPNPADFESSRLTSKTITSGGGGSPSGGGGSAAADGGTAHVDGKPVAAWIAPILAYAKQRGWQGTVQSGYRSVAEQARIYNSGVRPAAKPGQSNHNFTAFPGGAVDVSDAAHLAEILRRSPYAKKLVWAGGKDPVHFSHPSPSGAY